MWTTGEELPAGPRRTLCHSAIMSECSPPPAACIHKHGSASGRADASEFTDLLSVQLAAAQGEDGDHADRVGEENASIADLLRRTQNTVNDPVSGDVAVRLHHPVAHPPAGRVDRRSGGPLIDDGEHVALDGDGLDRSAEHAFGELDVLYLTADELVRAILALLEQGSPRLQEGHGRAFHRLHKAGTSKPHDSSKVNVLNRKPYDL